MITVPFAISGHGGVFIKAVTYDEVIDEFIRRMASPRMRLRPDARDACTFNLQTLAGMLAKASEPCRLQG
jgi:hypothetical protein